MTQSLTEGVSDGELGAYLDVLSIKPIYLERLLDVDWARNRYVWARVGYGFGGIHEGLQLAKRLLGDAIRRRAVGTLSNFAGILGRNSSED